MLTTPQVLEQLNISKTTLYKLMRAGVIAPVPRNPFVARPRRLYFERSEVERVIRESREPKAG